MISIQDEYRGLLAGTFFNGKPKKDRTGIGTKSVFGRMISHDMALGFPLLTTKKIYFVSCSPPILNPNIYGISIPTHTELIAYNRTYEEIKSIINVDKFF